MGKRSIVDLTEPEQTHLQVLTARGTVSARQLTRAPILLQAAAGATDTRITAALHVSLSTTERPRPGSNRNSTVPRSQAGGPCLLAAADLPEHRTMQLLADRLVALTSWSAKPASPCPGS